MEFAIRVLRGEELTAVVTKRGEVIQAPPSIRDRLTAMEWLADRAYGKAPQQLTGADGAELPISISISRVVKGEPDAQ